MKTITLMIAMLRRPRKKFSFYHLRPESTLFPAVSNVQFRLTAFHLAFAPTMTKECFFESQNFGYYLYTYVQTCKNSSRNKLFFTRFTSALLTTPFEFSSNFTEVVKLHIIFFKIDKKRRKRAAEQKGSVKLSNSFLFYIPWSMLVVNHAWWEGKTFSSCIGGEAL